MVARPLAAGPLRTLQPRRLRVVMTAPKCRHVATDAPRVLPGRHATTCPDKQPRPHGAPDTTTCQGCEPCTQPHCLSCGHRHAQVTCAHCTGLARIELWRITALDQLINTEVRRGNPTTDSETVMLDGPAAHPEAWYHVADSVRAGRIRGDVDANRHEDHPLWVLGWWEIAWRDHLNHDSTDRISVFAAAQYLDDHLTDMANRLEPPFEQFAADLRRCRAHLEDVLHDRDPKPKDCPKCGGPLVMDYDAATVKPSTAEASTYAEGNEDLKYEDKWQCRSRACREWWTDKDYKRVFAATYELHATKLTASAIARVHRVPESTVRTWAMRGEVRKRGTDTAGRMLYDVDDVKAMRDHEEAASATA